MSARKRGVARAYPIPPRGLKHACKPKTSFIHRTSAPQFYLMPFPTEAEAAAQELEIEEASEAEHVLHGADLVLVSYSLVALILIAIWAERRHVPSSLAAVSVGALLGLVLRLLGADNAPSLHSLLFFDEEMFLYVLLPPIIFEAGFSIEKPTFIRNLATILMYAVPGTILTTFVIGQACSIAGSAGWFHSGGADALDFRTPHDSYTFGALISATDPVATLAIMGAYSVDPLMYTLVAGESVLNDAVAIVLVRILERLGPESFAHPAAFLLGIWQFLLVSVGSVLVGVVVAAPSALLLKHSDLSGHESFELSLLLLLGYCAYPTAEAVQCSGILALFVCSVLMGHYHVQSLSTPTRNAAALTLRALAHLAETFVFMYMGLDLVAQRGAVDDLFDEDLGDAGVDESASTRRFVLFAVCIVPLSRLIVVPPITLLANAFRGRKRSLSCRETLFLVFAGLRGAIAYALARSSASPHQRTIVAATTAVVLFTTFVLGGTTSLMLRLLGMIAPESDGHSDGDHRKEQHKHQQLKPAVDAAGGDADGSAMDEGELTPRRRVKQRADGGGLGEQFAQFDARVLQPIFGMKPEGPEHLERVQPTNGGGNEWGVELEPIIKPVPAENTD